MEVIKASPESIAEVFTKCYIIPEYQRPYSWDIDRCERLWSDIIEAFDENKEQDYFLGSAVLIKTDNKTNGNETYEVIDGQQRLTSLILLLKACYDNHQFKGLYKRIHVFDKLTEEKSEDSVKIESKVLEEDKELLQSILNDKNQKYDVNMYINYKSFLDNVDKWKIDNPNKLELLITFILEKVKLLPIDCGTENSALRIFQTLNDRGTPLNDIDILKSRIYRHLSSDADQEDFISRWNDLDDKEYLFRIYMHIIRGKNGDFGNETTLRNYFEDKISVENASTIIEDLEKISAFISYDDIEFKYWIQVLYNYPVDLVVYPYFVLMYKYATIKNGNATLSKKDNDNLIILIKKIIEFVYIYGIIYKTRNTIKFDIFKCCVNIYKQSKFSLNDLLDIEYKNADFKKRFKDSLKLINNRNKYARSVLTLYHLLNNKQDKDIKTKDMHVEHILPKAWQNYDGWTEELYKQYINSLGNLTLFEKKLNIKAKNEFFDRKKEMYKKSKIYDVSHGITKLKKWESGDCENRYNEIEKRVVDFLFS